MPYFRDAPISRKLTLAFIGMSVAAVVLASAVFLAYDWLTERQSMADDIASLGAVIGNNSTAALTFQDPVTATEVLSALRARTHIQMACIYDNTDGVKREFAHYFHPDSSQNCPPSPTRPGVEFSSKHVTFAKNIMLDDEVIGSLFITKTLDELWNKVTLHIQVVTGVIFASLGLSFLAAAILQRGITGPILTLASTAQNIAESKNYALRAPVAGRDEVGQLMRHFNSMLAEIEDRDDEVIKARELLQSQVKQTTEANSELQDTLQRLKETQNQLVQTEKMASLGGLVAGVAHEINTPLGVGVTAASTLKTRTAEVNKHYEGDSLTASELKNYMSIANQSSSIILTNLTRAADLIHSFKQVAVDQSSSERRKFNLAGYIDEILLSLEPRIKIGTHHVTVECPPDIILDGYPGAISQILTNLVMNSLIHGFENKRNGNIHIKAHIEDEIIHFHYADDGAGMPKEHVAKAFDPFFTTKRGQGGSGLGLQVVYNLVTHTLNGQIAMSSTLGEGTVYDITFPKIEGNNYERQINKQ